MFKTFVLKEIINIFRLEIVVFLGSYKAAVPCNRLIFNMIYVQFCVIFHNFYRLFKKKRYKLGITRMF